MVFRHLPTEGNFSHEEIFKIYYRISFNSTVLTDI